MDTVRVLRILEYSGPRAAVEKHMQNVQEGTKSFRVSTNDELGAHYLGEITIRAATIGTFPEILGEVKPVPETDEEECR